MTAIRITIYNITYAIFAATGVVAENFRPYGMIQFKLHLSK